MQKQNREMYLKSLYMKNMAKPFSRKRFPEYFFFYKDFFPGKKFTLIVAWHRNLAITTAKPRNVQHITLRKRKI